MFRHHQIASHPKLLLIARNVEDSFDGVDDVDFQYDRFFADADQKPSPGQRS